MTVVTMPGVTADRPVGAQPQVDLIATLEGLLARARTGDLQAIAFAAVDSEAAIASGWAGASSSSSIHVAAAVFWLSHRFGNSFDDESTDKRGA